MYGQLKTLQPNADKRERANNFGGRNNLEIGFASLIADFTLIQSIEFHFQYIRCISRHTNTIKRTKREREKKKHAANAIYLNVQLFISNFNVCGISYYVVAMKREKMFDKNRLHHNAISASKP